MIQYLTYFTATEDEIVSMRNNLFLQVQVRLHSIESAVSNLPSLVCNCPEIFPEFSFRSRSKGNLVFNFIQTSTIIIIFSTNILEIFYLFLTVKVAGYQAYGEETFDVDKILIVEKGIILRVFAVDLRR